MKNCNTCKWDEWARQLQRQLRENPEALEKMKTNPRLMEGRNWFAAFIAEPEKVVALRDDPVRKLRCSLCWRKADKKGRLYTKWQPR